MYTQRLFSGRMQDNRYDSIIVWFIRGYSIFVLKLFLLLFEGKYIRKYTEWSVEDGSTLYWSGILNIAIAIHILHSSGSC